jgi:hypothetical protein
LSAKASASSEYTPYLYFLDGCSLLEDAEPNRSTTHHHPIDALSGLHSLDMNPVAARQSGHAKKSSRPTEEGKWVRNEKDEDEDSEEKTAENWSCSYKNRSAPIHLVA